MMKFHLVHSCDEIMPLEASIVSLAGVVGSARLESGPYNNLSYISFGLVNFLLKHQYASIVFH